MNPVEHSRALRLAEGVTGRASSQLEQQLEDSVVVLSVDPTVPRASLTLRVVLTTVRRLPGHLVLDRSGMPSPLVDQLAEAVSSVDPERPLRIADAERPRRAVRLHVGPSVGRGIIRVVPDGFGAHIANDWRAQITVARPGNALGAIYAAALGAGEVFKRTARVLPQRRSIYRHLRFCPVSLSADLWAAPDLVPGLQFDHALVGLGAIGTGTALILSELDAEGRILLVDGQRYAPENRGTYSLGGQREAREKQWKVDVAAAALRRYDIVPHYGSIEDLPSLVDAGAVFWPRFVLSGLDTVEARHATQRLWPDQLIDGATGDTALGLHHVRGDGGPCLMCFFPPRRDAPSSIQRLAEATGLPSDLLARGDAILSPGDLDGLSEQQRRQLQPHLGKPVCGLADALHLTELEADGYRPAVPFVSLQASCLVVGRILAVEMELAALPNFVQYDALLGPRRAGIENRAPRASCYCQSRRTTIEQVRHSRANRRWCRTLDGNV